MEHATLHSFDLKILREYDIRGTVGINLSEEDAFLLGQRFAYRMHTEGFKTVCVGRDGRLSSPSLAQALINGLVQHGLEVKDIGIGPTPMLYFAVKHLKTDAGIMVTGSHNPSQDNGFKMTLAHRPFFGQDIQQLNHPIPTYTGPCGFVEKVAIEQAYCDRLLQDYKPGRHLKIAWDPGNGAGGRIVEKLIQSDRLAVQSFPINTQIDGNFPNHHPDPTIPKNLQQLIKMVIEKECDLGIAFDGDADRIGVVDGKGRILWGDQLMILWSRNILEKSPQATIIADVKASQTLFDDIKAHGGHGIMARTGHSLIKMKIAETGALLAGEMSGHIFFADTYYGYDDALYAAVRLLNILHHVPYTLSELYDQLPTCLNTPEIRIDCDDDQKFKIIEQIQQLLRQKALEFNDVDGVRLSTGDGWWLLRASNTQALLVARCESSTHEGLERLKKNLQSYLTPFGLKIPE